MKIRETTNKKILIRTLLSRRFQGGLGTVETETDCGVASTFCGVCSIHRDGGVVELWRSAQGHSEGQGEKCGEECRQAQTRLDKQDL